MSPNWANHIPSVLGPLVKEIHQSNRDIFLARKNNVNKILGLLPVGMRLATHWKLSLVSAATFLLANTFNGVEGRSLSLRMGPGDKKTCVYAYLSPEVPLKGQEFIQFYYSVGNPTMEIMLHNTNSR